MARGMKGLFARGIGIGGVALVGLFSRGILGGVTPPPPPPPSGAWIGGGGGLDQDLYKYTGPRRRPIEEVVERPNEQEQHRAQQAAALRAENTRRAILLLTTLLADPSMWEDE